jgi:hypothetical protein
VSKKAARLEARATVSKDLLKNARIKPTPTPTHDERALPVE